MCSENVHEIDTALTIVTIAIVSRTYHSNNNYMHKASRDQVPSNGMAGGSSNVDNANNDQSEGHIPIGKCTAVAACTLHSGGMHQYNNSATSSRTHREVPWEATALSMVIK